MVGVTGCVVVFKRADVGTDVVELVDPHTSGIITSAKIHVNEYIFVLLKHTQKKQISAINHRVERVINPSTMHQLYRWEGGGRGNNRNDLFKHSLLRKNKTFYLT